MDAFLERLSDEPFRAGATFAVLFIGIGVGVLWFLNKKFRWWVSSDLLESESKRATKAEADADATAVRMQAALDNRVEQMREDSRERVSQVRSDSQAEMDRLIKFTEALQRDVESWRTAWNLADQANREESDARWDEVRAYMSRSVAQSAVIARFITELQRQAGSPARELEAVDDGGRESDVI